MSLSDFVESVSILEMLWSKIEQTSGKFSLNAFWKDGKKISA